MMTVIYIILGLVALILIIGFIAPKSYEVNRNITVNRSVSDVFQYLKYIKNQDNWSPWRKKDPNLTQTFEGVDGEVGFVSKWKGNKGVGMGEQEIKRIVENDRIETELRFLKPWKSQSDAYIKVEEINGNATNIIWGFSGRNPIPFNVFMLFFSFEKSVGKDFEEGLDSLKEILEN